MFKDYYLILEIPFESDVDLVKTAYKNKAKKFHPDKNKGVDTTKIMQDINEAYLILKDPEARILYNIEYKRFKLYERNIENKFPYAQKTNFEKNSQYVFNDELLKKWMDNARIQAESLVNETVENFKIGTKAAIDEMIQRTNGFLIVGVIFSLIFLLVKSCN